MRLGNGVCSKLRKSHQKLKHIFFVDEDKTPSPLPTTPTVQKTTTNEYQQQQQNMVSRSRRAVSEDIRNHSDSVVRNR